MIMISDTEQGTILKSLTRRRDSIEMADGLEPKHQEEWRGRYGEEFSALVDLIRRFKKHQ